MPAAPAPAPAARIVQAPMAGGPGGPALAAAVGEAGGLGFLAAGYVDTASLAEQIEHLRELSDRPFGVNLFVPERTDGAGPRELSESERHALGAYRERLEAELTRASDAAEPAASVGSAVPAPLEDAARADDDAYSAKLRLLAALPQPPAVVSFTFGLPTREELAALHTRGIFTVATVTSEREAVAAVELGLGGLCVQGAEAGGHRGTHRVADEPDARRTLELVAAVRGALSAAGLGTPWIAAAGGIMEHDDVAAVLAAGADAAQCGSAFLLAEEAGTTPTHRAALAALGPAGATHVTRAFTGRPARAIPNAFSLQHDEAAPWLYPAVHHLTRPLRAAAARTGDAERLHLWAGARAGLARPVAAARIVAALQGGS